MNMDTIKRMAYASGITEEEFGLGVGWGDLERFAKLVFANHPPQSFMSWQEGYEAGQLAERQKFLGALRQLHDSFSLASDSSKLKARNK